MDPAAIRRRGIGPDLRLLLRRLRWGNLRYLRCIHCNNPKRRRDAAVLLDDGDIICWGCNHD
jgi:hypothetical protein